MQTRLKAAVIGLGMCAGAMSSQAQADTYVFITNTTPETVTVNVNHYGTRTLAKGSEWA
jgi:hypothetical protein